MKGRWADESDDEGPMGRTNWADVDDDDVAGGQAFGFGSRTVSAPDKNGIKIATEYVERDGKAYKITSTIQEKKVVKKTNVFIEGRKKWKNFGACHGPDAAADYGPNKPVQADEDIHLEVNKEKILRAVGEEDKFYEKSVRLCESVLNEAKQKKWDAAAIRKKKELEEEAAAAQHAAGAGGKGMGGKGVSFAGGKGGDTDGLAALRGNRDAPGGAYQPPSRQKGGGDRDRPEQTLRVQNLSDEVKDGDLHILFATFGRLARVFVAKHKDGEKVGLCKGFAYITYYEQKDAEAAIKKLNGHGYDHRILSVDWAKPRDN